MTRSGTRLVEAWRRQSTTRQLVIASIAVMVGLLAFAGVAVGLRGGGVDSLPGVEVPADELGMINSAAGSCPTLTPPRLAGQIMANSGFDPASARPERSGIAGLTDAQWKKWAPSPTATRSSIADNIIALAHHMCDLVGDMRASARDGDLWRLALASFLTGPGEVTKTGAIPDGEAGDYVTTVAAYANWYQQQPQFGGGGPPNPVSNASAAAAKPVPDALVSSVLTAGALCSAVTSPKIAALLMARSGFNPDQVGRAGEQGIAQFKPQTWARYNHDPHATPWDSAAAIVTLGRAMCDLSSQVAATAHTGDPFSGALTAFDRGLTSVAEAGGVPSDPNRTFVTQVNTYTAYYSTDPRLKAPGPTPTTARTTPRPATSTHAPTGRPTPAPTAIRTAYARIEAESYGDQSGSGVEPCVDSGGGQDVGYLTPGDWLKYRRVDFGSTPATKFAVRYSGDLPAGMTGVIQIRLESPTAAPIGGAAIANTGGWQSWTTALGAIAPVTGIHDVYLTFATNNGWEIGNINWFEFGH